MLTIRLQRMGKKKFPTYRLIVSEKTRDPQARHLEIVGLYNPHDKDKGLVVKEDRIKYWISVGAQTSNTVHNLLLKLGIISGKKKKSVTISDTRKKKLVEKNKQKIEAKKVVEEKAKEVEETKKAKEVKVKTPAVEAKTEEAPAEKKTEEKVKEDISTADKKEEIKIDLS